MNSIDASSWPIGSIGHGVYVGMRFGCLGAGVGCRRGGDGIFGWLGHLGRRARVDRCIRSGVAWALVVIALGRSCWSGAAESCWLLGKDATRGGEGAFVRRTENGLGCIFSQLTDTVQGSSLGSFFRAGDTLSIRAAASATMIGKGTLVTLG